jgi:hypothetical protein
MAFWSYSKLAMLGITVSVLLNSPSRSNNWKYGINLEVSYCFNKLYREPLFASNLSEKEYTSFGFQWGVQTSVASHKQNNESHAPRGNNSTFRTKQYKNFQRVDLRGSPTRTLPPWYEKRNMKLWPVWPWRIAHTRSSTKAREHQNSLALSRKMRKKTHRQLNRHNFRCF